MRSTNDMDTHPQRLTEEIRQTVLEGCRKNLRPRPLNLIVSLLFAVAFIPLGFMAIKQALTGEDSIFALFIGAIFLLVPFFIAYPLLFRPWRDLKRAERDDYEFYAGRLTDKTVVKNDEDTDHHMTLDGQVKCYCTKRQYKEAVIGEEYVAVYFDHNDEEPRLFLRLYHKDRI